MLLRQKAIVEGGLCADRAAARCTPTSPSTADAERAPSALLDLLTPVAKSFPAERGFEANALAVQVHGGYGYTSEYLVEALLRDQKLNSIHEGTTGIQGLDLLGRKAVAPGALALLRDEIEATARTTELPIARDVVDAIAIVEDVTRTLAGKGLAGDVDGMLLHSSDYLELFGILVIAWQHLAMAAVAPADAFGAGKLRAAEYWIATELPRVATLAALCKCGEDSYARVRPDEL